MRSSRITVGMGGVYHCIARIVGGERLLGDREKEAFRRMLWRQAEFCGMEIVTYCLMSNHVHILLRLPEVEEISDAELVRRLGRLYPRRKETWVQMVETGFAKSGVLSGDIRRRLQARMGDVSVFMKELKHRFTLWYNHAHERFGTLWAERFKSVLIEDESEAMKMVAMYIDLNPVRAGLVDDPKDYRFCGYAEAVVGNRAIRAGLVRSVHANSWRQAAGRYRMEMMDCAGEDRPGKMSLRREKILEVLNRGGRLAPAELLRLRIRYFSAGAVLGSREFVERIYAEFRDRFGARRKSGARRIRDGGGALKGIVTVRDLQKLPFS